ncbi:MAG: T9SS type A sorting domain-containing protein [Ignavibacteriae bacterium]|nr:T9SS type A sorting domain-containing protein [Ignavibacteriota bacterium]
MRVCIKVLLILLITGSCVFSQEESINLISDVSARIVKKSVELKWRVEKDSPAAVFRIEYKKGSEEIYLPVDKISLSEFEFKREKDSVEYLFFSLKHVPVSNGVFLYRIAMLDNFGNELSFQEIKVGYSEKSDLLLHQNNPNPFNPVTNISFELNSTTRVKLKVFSIDGKEVAVLLDEVKNPGSYKIEFNISKYGNYSSGIYFYKIDTDYSSDIKKMIYTK